MDERLYKATMEGNTEALVKLIEEDPLILDRTNTITTTYSETPLHIAAMLGHEDFAVELLKRKPGLARQLDSRRSSPLHVGAATGHVGIVKALLLVYPDACFARDRDGRNPVHVAAVMGLTEVLKEMVAVRPAAMRHGETVLHLCVKYCQFEALKVVMESVDFADMINDKDKNGNTVLHLAVADKQVETTEFLLSVPRLDINALNHSGMTAMDILIQRRRDIRDLEMEETLKHAGATNGGNNNITTSFFQPIKDNPNPQYCSCRNIKTAPKKQRRNQDDWLDKKRSALMVVASLIATMAFQAGVNPPPHIWPDTQTANSTQTLQNNSDRGNALYYVRKASDYFEKGEAFYVCNTTSFIASLSIILLLMSGLPLKSRFFVWVLLVIAWIAISGVALAYAIGVLLQTPSGKEKSTNALVWIVVSSWICLMSLLLVGHTVRLLFKVVKMVLKMVLKMVKSLYRKRSYRSAMHRNNPRV